MEGDTLSFPSWHGEGVKETSGILITSPAHLHNRTVDLHMGDLLSLLFEERKKYILNNWN